MMKMSRLFMNVGLIYLPGQFVGSFSIPAIYRYGRKRHNKKIQRTAGDASSFFFLPLCRRR
jgi:hypothetical protein